MGSIDIVLQYVSHLAFQDTGLTVPRNSVFDLSDEYGPCVGLSRLERWERSEKLGLSPPPEVCRDPAFMEVKLMRGRFVRSCCRRRGASCSSPASRVSSLGRVCRPLVE